MKRLKTLNLNVIVSAHICDGKLLGKANVSVDTATEQAITPKVRLGARVVALDDRYVIWRTLGLVGDDAQCCYWQVWISIRNHLMDLNAQIMSISQNSLLFNSVAILERCQ